MPTAMPDDSPHISATPPRRRASVLIALVIALVIVQIAVFGIVIQSSTEHNLTKLRLESMQAQYASEAAMNMSLKEIYDDADEDTDGTIGSISAKTLNGASASVAKSVAGSTTTLTSTAAATTASRATQASITSSTGTRVFISQGTGSAIYQTAKAASSWSTPASSGSTNAQPVWISAAPISATKTIVAAMDTAGHLNIGAADSSGTATYTDACSDLFGTGTRSFDLATDVANSRAVIPYWNNTSSLLRYRTHNGTTLSAESTIGITLAGGEHVETVRTNSRGSGSGIVMLSGTDASALWGAVWNGSSWTSISKLSSSLSTTTYGPYDAAYELSSGHILAIYCDASNNVVYRTYNGSWSFASTLGTSGAGFNWIRLASRPGTDEIYALGLDSSGDVWAGRWTGSAWASFTQVAGGLSYADRRQIDVACTPDGAGIIITYGIGTYIYYRTWTGSAWSSQSTGPNLGANVQWIQLVPGASGTDIQCIGSTTARRLYFTSWTGSGFSSATNIQNTLSTEDDHERFALVPNAGGGSTITAWQQIAP